MPDVRRVHLELQEEQVVVAGRDVPEIERKPPVAARLADRARLDGVEGHPLEPAGIEHERRVANLANRLDVKARLEDQAAADAPRRVQLELDARGRRGA